MMSDQKRDHRRRKREIKQAGNRKRRRAFQRDLDRNPEGAAESIEDLGGYSSESMNGNDNDATRRKKAPEEDEE